MKWDGTSTERQLPTVEQELSHVGSVRNVESALLDKPEGILQAEFCPFRFLGIGRVERSLELAASKAKGDVILKRLAMGDVGE